MVGVFGRDLVLARLAASVSAWFWLGWRLRSRLGFGSVGDFGLGLVLARLASSVAAWFWRGWRLRSGRDIIDFIVLFVMHSLIPIVRILPRHISYVGLTL